MLDNNIIQDIQTLPAVALRGLVMFPGMTLHFDVGRKKSVKALNSAMQQDRRIFLVAQKNIGDDNPSFDDMYKIGVIGIVKQIIRLPKSENIRVVVEGVERARTAKIVTNSEYLTASVMPIGEPKVEKTDELYEEALVRHAKDVFDAYTENSPQLSSDILMNVLDAKQSGFLADYIGFNIMLEYTDRQKILEIINPIDRLEFACRVLVRETEILDIEAQIHAKVQQQMDKSQHDYYLREQMRVIAEELDEDDDPKKEAQEYKDKISALKLPQESEEKLLKDCDRLYKMPSGSQDGAVLRSYLDTVLSLPWNNETKDQTDIKKAAKVLNSGHYGMEKVKERILEYIAVKKLTKTTSGQILCLVGPPGVGKTSIAKAMADALGRNFARISLGGIHDEAEIRGHRKTYVGAMPGRIITAIKQCKSSNPLILLDEIDKLSGDHRGDPSSALLEVLDPAQNYTFTDHYIEIPFDLSNVLFVTTANDKYSIPAPLFDRMDVIELDSYTREDKFTIAKKYLVPAQLKKHGLNGSSLRISSDAIYDIIDSYTRESGVRRLEQLIAALCRKAAVKIAGGDCSRVSVKMDNIEEFLGPRKFKPEEKAGKDEIGVVTGLAWTSVGGETMPVEVAVMDGKGEVKLTGSLGDVMKESAIAAISYIRSNCDRFNIDKDFYKNKDIHIHVPEGAVPKDGPSAGVTITTALVSALTGIPVKGDVAMTGEVTLRGRVLPIGGLKEKTMAAYRHGIKKVIIPADNESDLKEADPKVIENIEFVTAETMDTVLKNALVCNDAKENELCKEPCEKHTDNSVTAVVDSHNSGKRPSITQ